MEIKITTKHLLIFLQIIAWIIFIGVSIDAGGFIFNSFYTLFIRPMNAQFFWNHLDFSQLYAYDRGYFIVVTMLINIVAVLRAMMFFMIVKFMYDKKLDLSKPFNQELRRFVLNIGYFALGISFFSSWAAKYTIWLSKKGIALPDLQELRIAGADVWVFMSVIMFVIALILKKGIELQSENDLTV